MKLLIRPNYETTTRFLSYYTKDLLPINSIIINSGSVNRTMVENVIKKNQIDAIFFFGHGVENAMLGTNNEPIIVSGINDELLRGKIVTALSCRTAGILGKNSPAVSYIGYDDDFIFMSQGNNPAVEGYAKDFMNAGLLATKLINEGKSTQEAYNETIKEYDRLINKWKDNEDPLASYIISFFQHNRDHLIFIGKNARLEITEQTIGTITTIEPVKDKLLIPFIIGGLLILPFP